MKTTLPATLLIAALGAALGAALAPAAPAAAEGLSRSTLFAAVGFGRFGDDEGSLGHGATFSGGFEYRPLPRLGFEAYASRSHNHRSFASEARFEGDHTYLGGSAVYHFSPGKRVTPFVLGGIGTLHSRRTSRFILDPDLELPQVYRYDDRQLAWHFGGGLEAALGDHLAIRAEARYLTSTPDYLNHLSGSIGLAFRF